METKLLQLPNCLIADRVVSRGQWAEYTKAVGIPYRSDGRPSREPILGVSQIGAFAYCRWLGREGGQLFRLGTHKDLLELLAESIVKGCVSEVFSKKRRQIGELRSGCKPEYNLEWTANTKVVRGPTQMGERVLGEIFYPGWYSNLETSKILSSYWDYERARNKLTQGHFPATEGYSFVTFRVARSL